MLGIRDDHVRERLLRSNELTLQKAVDIIKAAEQTQQQVKFMTAGEDSVNLLHKQRSERAQQPLEMNHRKCLISALRTGYLRIKEILDDARTGRVCYRMRKLWHDT